jgi:hypothetical protein
MRFEDLSDVEIEILKVIRHVGWYGQLWFPHVFRDALDFQEGPTDQEIHLALFGLIRSRVLEAWNVDGADSSHPIEPTDEILTEIQKHASVTEIELRIQENVISALDHRERPRLGRVP